MLDDYLALGNRVENAVQARWVSWPDTPSIHDANHGQRVGARAPDAIDAVLREHARRQADHGCRHRCFQCDHRTPPEFEARLLLEGYTLSCELQLVLEGPLRADPPRIELRRVESEKDWSVVGALAREEHLDQARRLGTEVYDESVTRGLVEGRRRRAGEERTFLARVDGTDCACFSSWPGRQGVGKVENLFTLPAFRHRGIATALIAHAVDDARARGAPAVNIGADPRETPMHMYAALGFRPIAVRRSYLGTGSWPRR
ncbi:MAG: GNAT family N-acetyltransferase [Myxococcota bacterium]